MDHAQHMSPSPPKPLQNHLPSQTPPQVCLLYDSKPSKLEIKSECEGYWVLFAVSRWQVAELVNALLHGYLRF